MTNSEDPTQTVFTVVSVLSVLIIKFLRYTALNILTEKYFDIGL